MVNEPIGLALSTGKPLRPKWGSNDELFVTPLLSPSLCILLVVALECVVPVRSLARCLAVGRASFITAIIAEGCDRASFLR